MRQDGDDDEDTFMVMESPCGVSNPGSSSSSMNSSIQRLRCEFEEIRAESEIAVHSFQTQSKELAASFLNKADDILEQYTLSGHRATARALSLCDKLGQENETLRAQLDSKKEDKAWSTPQAKRRKSSMKSMGTPLEFAQVAASHNSSQGNLHADLDPSVQGRLPFTCFIEDWESASVLARSDEHTPSKEVPELTARFAAKYIGLCLCDHVKHYNAPEDSSAEHEREEHRIIVAVDWLPQGYRAQTILEQTEASGSGDTRKEEPSKGYMVNSTLLELIKSGKNPERAMVSRSICA